MAVVLTVVGVCLLLYQVCVLLKFAFAGNLSRGGVLLPARGGAAVLSHFREV